MSFEQNIFDVETNGYLNETTEIHCIVIKDIQSGKVGRFHDYWSLPSDGPLSEGIDILHNAKLLIGHNISVFDLDALEKVTGRIFSAEGNYMDSMFMSCIVYPNMRKNSLEAWAVKLGLAEDEQKIQNEDWTKLTENMLNRCVSDVNINHKVFNYLLAKIQELHRKYGDVLHISDALRLEYQVGRIHAKQTQHGIYYDVSKAVKHRNKYDKLLAEIYERVLRLAPKRVVQPYAGPVKKPFLKAGGYNKTTRDWFKGDKAELVKVQGPYSRIRFDPINLNSGQQVKDFLLKLGWKPTEWNFKEDPMGNLVKTSPKLTEDSYGSLPDGLGKDIAHYNVLKHRRSLLQNMKDQTTGSLPLAMKNFDYETNLGRVSADAFTCGTPTARYTHIKPVANIPGVEAPYGVDMREIYRAPYGAYQVGVDLSGIEARMLCHLCFDYEGGPEFAKLVLEGDWHSVNAKNWGVARKTAKGILYAMMYGAGDGNLGAQAGSGGAARGAKIRKVFLESNPAYAELVEDLTDAYRKNKFIPSMDGRPLYPRSLKDVLNTTIQGNSAVVFKKWMVNCDKLEDVKEKHAAQMVAYHDELQFAYYGMNYWFNPECFGQRVVDMAVLTGEQMGLKVKIDAEYKVGKNYADCH